MNLQTLIRSELWLAISNTYQAQNYSHAILDAMHYLSDVLREKTGVDGDGAQLVGQALGGDSPRLRVNKLQTETERNIQKGLQQVLMGLYLAIRNPRSHEQIEDSKDTADSIILFINFVLSIINQSEQPFRLEKFLERIFDPDFVASNQYASLLAGEIPANKLLDTLIEVYRNRTRGDGKKLAYITRAIVAKLSEENIIRFATVVSDDLKIIQDEASIRLTLQTLPPHLWPRLSEVARLRIENKLIGSIKDGISRDSRSNPPGALGTWARDYAAYFTLKRELGFALIQKLEGVDFGGHRYVANFFMRVLPDAISGKILITRCMLSISRIIRGEDQGEVRQALLIAISSYPENWQQELVKHLKDLTDPNSPAITLSDGTPFLKEDDEIPF